ncbi:hypothetical protein BBG03_03440 [Streptococcus dysgalactiae subsp. equisimilis]|uniref:hypothetical protein n=1 Tax=Streptococcus dysgalactiae TaxID=1334 RepID=UPI0008071C9C|nr:hypothetical protein [Streptococcus dysgalactiae]OBZ00649.1 hypothetical protein BBG03_03440 [Streptococcus dysgalactiae subsp. equisimilis]
MIRAKIRNPVNGRSLWFNFPLYFGRLSLIGHSCNYEDEVEVMAVEGTLEFPVGHCKVADLENLNHVAER